QVAFGQDYCTTVPSPEYYSKTQSEHSIPANSLKPST
uniref:Uncharacterized protein n=1 Tax=Homo sapiens TaxID=9606 RepID=A0A0G2JPN4_HUMAN